MDILREALLLDGAESSSTVVENDLAAARRVCSDRSRPIEDRLEAYEDVFESEVGDTILSRARNIEREVHLRQIYLKFEGDNPSGTQKDRIAFAQALDALRRGFRGITVATCGNYGVAVAFAASLAGLRCIVYVPETYRTRRIEEIEQHGSEVLRVPGDYETAVEVSRNRADEDEIYDANPGGANTALQLRAYGEIAYEIYDELRDAPAVVAVPVSNGTTIAGIHKGFVSLYRRGKTSRIPMMVAGSSFGKNPIVRAFRCNAPTCENLLPDRIRETPVNEPLINWSSIDGDQALHSIRGSSGWASYISDRNMLRFSRIVREQQGLSVLPAATAGLVALLDRHQSESLPNDRYVAILTGRKS
jgi:threonine synthase